MLRQDVFIIFGGWGWFLARTHQIRKPDYPPLQPKAVGSCRLKEGLWRKELICFSGPPCLVSPAHGERESALCTHHVGQRDGLGLSSLAVMSLGVAWCKEVSAETVEGRKKIKNKTVRPFFRPGFLLPRCAGKSARLSFF